MTSRLLGWCSVCALLLATATALAEQEAKMPHPTGTHALRAILNQKFKIKPLNQAQFEAGMRRPAASSSSPHPSGMLLIVLGEPGYLEELGSEQLKRFVQRGGALLVATDQKTGEALQEAFRVRITGDFLEVLEKSPFAYRGLPEFPIVRDFDDDKHPIFRAITNVATMRPSDLVLAPGSPLQSLARFPADAHWELEVRPSPDVRYRFAAGQKISRSDRRPGIDGKVLVLSDHSVFINDMILRLDNDNLLFAYNCMDWLTDSGKRNHVLFVEDREFVTDFNVSLKEAPSIPLPPEGVLVEKGEQLLAGVEESDVPERVVRQFMPEGLKPSTLLLLLAPLLVILGLWRLSKARYRIERQEPLLAACLAAPGAAGTLIRRRNDYLLRSNNYWETAHQLARQCFEALPIIPAHGARPQIKVQGGWWRRRTMTRQVQRLWHLADGTVPELITAQQFRRFEGELQQLRTALENGTIQVK
jgi:hypothetical protein